jgi:hypothetical protein
MFNHSSYLKDYVVSFILFVTYYFIIIDILLRETPKLPSVKYSPSVFHQTLGE